MSESLKLTQQQQAAITTRDVSVALSAGAGCGKTFVLTERFLSHLDPQSDQPPLAQLRELVAFTFTERAAREMRERIRTKCIERLESADQKTGSFWLSLLRQLDSARVSTIHSFCASLLRTYAVQAKLDPTFGIFEPNQTRPILKSLIEDELRTQLSDHHESALALVVEYGFSQFKQNIATLVDKASGQIYSDYLELSAEELVERWQRFLDDVVCPQIKQEILDSPDAKSILNLFEYFHPTDELLAERKQVFLNLFSTLEESNDLLYSVSQLRDATMLAKIGGKKAWPDEELFLEYKTIVTSFRKLLDKLKPILQFDQEAALVAAKYSLQTLSIAHGVRQKYEHYKRENNVLDFDDLITLATHLLTSPETKQVKTEMAHGISMLLVDELQDTDSTQVKLINALCNDEMASGKLFIVGDFKQSIYRFRGADPQVFRSLRQQMSEQGRLPLTLNFRSQPEVISFFNALFFDEFGDQFEPLVAHRQQASPTPAVEFMWAADSGNSREKGASKRKRKREADWIARRIRQMLDDQVPRIVDENSDQQQQLRPVMPGDIAILFRVMSDVQHYEEALRNYEIPYYLVGGKAFYSQQEIYDLLNLLRTLISFADELSLAGVLRSSFFSLTDETLFWLKQERESLWQGLLTESISQNINQQQQQRVKFAASTLIQLQQQKDHLPIAQLINLAISKTGYDAILLSEYLGQRKLANLHKFIDRARSYDQSNLLTLADFVIELQDFILQQPDEALAATHLEGSNVVRMMTVHQSKGLEFPVVILTDIDRKKTNRSDSTYLSSQLGPMVNLPATNTHAGKTTGYKLYGSMTQREELAEQTRLFYVATTRAADYLILCSGVFDLDKPEGPWTTILAEHFDLKTGRQLAAGDREYPAPQINVITAEPPLPQLSSKKSSTSTNWQEVISQVQEQTTRQDGSTRQFTRPIPANPHPKNQLLSFSKISGALHQDDYLSENVQHDSPVLSLTKNIYSKDKSADDAMLFGTIIHEILAAIDWNQADDIAALAKQKLDFGTTIDSSTEQEVMQMISLFEKSSLAANLQTAKQVYQETEFLLSWPIGSDDLSQQILIRGFIDSIYQDQQGNWHLLDYKTNRVAQDQLQNVASQYELQIYLYSLAAEQVLKEPLMTQSLYFLRTEGEYQFQWSEADKSRLSQLIENAIKNIQMPINSPEIF